MARGAVGRERGSPMKACKFDYQRPESVAAACRLLADDADARAIAGGQSLIPMLAMRLARPSVLVDVLRIPEMSGIEECEDAIVIGAATRQVDVERSDLISAGLPLLAKAMAWVGHPATRNRGTVGGSIAHADPSAEIPLVALTLGAELVVAEDGGEEIVPLDDFFLGPTITALPPSGLIVAVRFPLRAGSHVGTAFHEVSPRKGDFALAAAAAEVVLDDNRCCLDVRIGVAGIGDTPVRLDVASEALRGTNLDEREVAGALAQSLEEVETNADLHASAEYRKRVGGVLARRAILAARDDALQRGRHARRASH